jgi:ribonuclease HI
LQITIYFDGGARGNPGVAGAGAEVVVVDSTANNQKTTYLIRQYCGDHETNNYAEYNGLIKGLQQAKAFVAEHIKKKTTGATPLFTLEVYGDSNLIIQQMRGNWKCKNDNIKPLYGQCLQLIKELQSMGANSEVSYDHVYRDQNKTADELANEAMDQRRSWVTSNGSASASNAEEDGKMPAQRTKTEAVYSDDDDEGSTISC